jgi:hypothetical protein
MHQIGEQLLRESKAAIGAGVNDEAAGSIEKDDLRGRDLLSLLVRANVATDIPESQRLSDDDAVARKLRYFVGEEYAHQRHAAQRYPRFWLQDTKPQGLFSFTCSCPLRSPEFQQCSPLGPLCARGPTRSTKQAPRGTLLA